MLRGMKRVRLVPHQSTEAIELQGMSDEEDEDEDDDDDVRNDTKPLMHKKKRSNGRANGHLQARVVHSSPRYRRCCGPLCWLFLAFKTLVALLIVSVVSINYMSHSNFYFWHVLDDVLEAGDGKGATSASFAACQGVKVIDVWSTTLPKMRVEGNLRMLNVSQDDVLDLVMGFGTGADGYHVPDVVCDVYFEGQRPCFGGVLALDGRDGSTLWTTWTQREVFGITCQADLDNDGVHDCLANGRGGLLVALSGRSGRILWQLSEGEGVHSDLLSVFNVQMMSDLTGDEVPDVLAVHGGDELSDPAMAEHMFGRLLLLDGRDGRVVRWMQTPDRKESFYPPQVLVGSDGEELLLFATGTTSKSGALYVISLQDLFHRRLDNAVQIYEDEHNGLMTPAVLVDINNDQVDDIIVVSFGASVVAIDGASFKPIWNVSFEEAHTQSALALALFDHDQVPDVILKLNVREGDKEFPIYTHEKTVVLSGVNGSELSGEAVISSLGSQASPLSLSMMGKGNDMFLHWSNDCQGHEGRHLHYDFPDYASEHDKLRAPLCPALLQSRQVVRLRTLSCNVSSVTIYDSVEKYDKEHVNITHTADMLDSFLKKKPSLMEDNESSDNNDPYSVLPFRKSDLESTLTRLREELVNAYGTDSKSWSVPKSPRKQANLEQMLSPGYAQPHEVVKSPVKIKETNFDINDLPRPRKKANRARTSARFRRSSNGDSDKHSHQHWSLYRLLSTGTLAPPILSSNDSMDVLFASHWLYPSRVELLHPEDVVCVRKRLESVVAPNSDDQTLMELEAEAVDHCLQISGHTLPSDIVYETISNPLVRNMGQTTVYRVRLRCLCHPSSLESGLQCGQFLPFQHQRWPAFMGSRGDGYYNG